MKHFKTKEMKLSKKEILMFDNGLSAKETEQLIYEKRIGQVIYGGVAVVFIFSLFLCFAIF